MREPPLPAKVAFVVLGIRPKRWSAWNEALVESRAWAWICAAPRALGLTLGALSIGLLFGNWLPVALVWLGMLAIVLPLGMMHDRRPTTKRFVIARLRGTCRPGRAERLAPIVGCFYALAWWGSHRHPDRSDLQWLELASCIALVATLVLAGRERRAQMRQLGS